jgi:hypothetical protein
MAKQDPRVTALLARRDAAMANIAKQYGDKTNDMLAGLAGGNMTGSSLQRDAAEKVAYARTLAETQVTSQADLAKSQIEYEQQMARGQSVRNAFSFGATLLGAALPFTGVAGKLAELLAGADASTQRLATMRDNVATAAPAIISALGKGAGFLATGTMEPEAVNELVAGAQALGHEDPVEMMTRMLNQIDVPGGGSVDYRDALGAASLRLSGIMGLPDLSPEDKTFLIQRISQDYPPGHKIQEYLGGDTM